MEDLFEYSADPIAAQQIRLAYSRLGLSILDRVECERLAKAEAAIAKLQMQLRHQNYLSAVARNAKRKLNKLNYW